MDLIKIYMSMVVSAWFDQLSVGVLLRLDPVHGDVDLCIEVREIIHGKKADPTIERWVHLLTLFGSLWMDASLRWKICGCRRFRDERPQNDESFGVGSPEDRTGVARDLSLVWCVLCSLSFAFYYYLSLSLHSVIHLCTRGIQQRIRSNHKAEDARWSSSIVSFLKSLYGFCWGNSLG
ncbi:uncharacterized protein HKW66_Vig0157490 [Vigna angularis]|uniref:Uncharacterized protein n=1 Tax=Phaseolus angularis TaxID=3914 RepID=A0A8T0JLR1_PHAAN|nr:uncharacterized protein HKW66_Vig0157490 [Vigna angularis]